MRDSSSRRGRHIDCVPTNSQVLSGEAAGVLDFDLDPCSEDEDGNLVDSEDIGSMDIARTWPLVVQRSISNLPSVHEARCAYDAIRSAVDAKGQ